MTPFQMAPRTWTETRTKRWLAGTEGRERRSEREKHFAFILTLWVKDQRGLADAPGHMLEVPAKTETETVEVSLTDIEAGIASPNLSGRDFRHSRLLLRAGQMSLCQPLPDIHILNHIYHLHRIRPIFLQSTVVNLYLKSAWEPRRIVHWLLKNHGQIIEDRASRLRSN